MAVPGHPHLHIDEVEEQHDAAGAAPAATPAAAEPVPTVDAGADAHAAPAAAAVEAAAAVNGGGINGHVQQDDDEPEEFTDDGDDGDEYEDATSSGDSHASEQAVPEEPQALDPIRDRGVLTHGCTHYRRRAQLVMPCCGEVMWCRHCHDLKHNEEEQDFKKQHKVDRKSVKEVVCALCELRQPIAESCSGCGVCFGRYTCLTCNFFDDDLSKKCFHCEDCGICRVGGRDAYFHCPTCNSCYGIALRNLHVCVQDSMHQNCPVCFEYLFDSIRPISVMTCGHTIHQDCFRSLVEHRNYSCPMCMKSVMSASQMGRVWANMDMEVQDHPMPLEYQNTHVDILCNDCGQRCNVLFHVIGHKCQACGAYNTRRL